MRAADRTILMIEDESSIRRFLRISLEAHGYGVIEARLGEQGLALCAEAMPDLVMLDLGLPDIDGLEVIARLRSWSRVPVVVLSVRADERQKVAALDAGANDYVTKPFGISELLARVRAQLRDHPAPTDDAPVVTAGALTIAFDQRTVTSSGHDLHLTRKEFDLLALLVRHRGRLLTHRQILDEVWGPRGSAEIRNLRVLVGSLRSKLGDDPARPRFVLTEPGIGYRFGEN